ncbi:hypothetical protein NFI96_017421 [Prochilodus magdalenae]|nr:hypothetical protein NFI96_017421 [Prochilodus magdalenae]
MTVVSQTAFLTESTGLEWAPQSPDPYPTEHLWDVVEWIMATWMCS